MRLARVFFHRLRSLLRGSLADEELQREIEIHVEQLAKEYAAAGMSVEEARAAALRDFGSITEACDRCRDTRRVHTLESVFRDLGYACRLWMKSPGFTATAVLSLAVGIGANTAIFSVIDAVLLRMLPVRDPSQLIEITSLGGRTLSYPFFEAIRDRATAFSGVLLLSGGRITASAYLGGASLGDVHLSPVSGRYFDVLGVSPVAGRMLTGKDMQTSDAAVLSFGFWQRAFAGNPAVLGKILSIGGDSRAYTIVGIAPESFTGVAAGWPVDIWIPVTPNRNPVAFIFRILARRKPGVTESQTRADVELIARQLSREWGFDGSLPVEVTSANGGLTMMRRRFRRPLLVLMLVSALLLLMASLNVANLLLARASARRREIGVRLSLGASRSRLVRQLLTESLVLGVAGAGAGLLLAPAAAAFLVRFLSSSAGVVYLPFQFDARLLAFAAALSLLVVLLFGLAPALAATRADLTPMFASQGAGRQLTRRGKLLMVAQAGISCLLLSGALLFGRSFEALSRVDAGFHPEHVLLLHLETASGGPRGVGRVRLYDRVLRRLAEEPAVGSVALSSESLFSGSTWTENVSVSGVPPARGADRNSVLLMVSPRFFRTMGISILRGRDIGPHDDENAPKVAVVNEAMARYYFGPADPIGRTFRLESTDFPLPFTVIGLVRNAKYGSLKKPAPRTIYLPALQVPAPFGGANIAVRTAAAPAGMASLLWEAAQRESPYLRFAGFTTQKALVDGTIAQDRMLAQLSGFFGLSGAILVSLGLYGLTSYQVSRRTAEIGVRLALGAQRRDVLRMVLQGSLVLVWNGLALGLGASLFLGRLVEGLLFQVHAFDPVTLLTAPLLLLAASTAGAWAPARRAARLDPVRALHWE